MAAALNGTVIRIGYGGSYSAGPLPATQDVTALTGLTSAYVPNMALLP
jgi:hypothetical protein